jgi:hypothetical protein
MEVDFWISFTISFVTSFYRSIINLWIYVNSHVLYLNRLVTLELLVYEVTKAEETCLISCNTFPTEFNPEQELGFNASICSWFPPHS